MIKRILTLVIAFPVAILLISLAVANRHGRHADPRPVPADQPALSLVLPFYAYLSARFLWASSWVEVATWLSQGPMASCCTRPRLRRKTLASGGRPAPRGSAMHLFKPSARKAISGPSFSRDAA